MLVMRNWLWRYFVFRSRLLAWIVFTLLFSAIILIFADLVLGIEHELMDWVGVLIGGGLAGYLISGKPDEKEKERDLSIQDSSGVDGSGNGADPPDVPQQDTQD